VLKGQTSERNHRGHDQAQATLLPSLERKKGDGRNPVAPKHENTRAGWASDLKGRKAQPAKNKRPNVKVVP
jgi:hypothetical protein